MWRIRRVCGCGSNAAPRRLPACVEHCVQGVPGAYSEQASLLAYESCTPAPFDQFEHAFEAGAAACAVRVCCLLTPARPCCLVAGC